jgi:putative alpha-1,2-mannosidase
VWTTLGLYPYYPGRSELLLSTPLFPRAEVIRSNGVRIVVTAEGADAPYVHGVTVDGANWSQAWLPEPFVAKGGEVGFTVSNRPGSWGRAEAARPPSFGR